MGLSVRDPLNRPRRDAGILWKPGLPGVASAYGFAVPSRTALGGCPKALPLLVPVALALATPEGTRSTIIERSNSANNAHHLQHRLAGRHGVDALLM